MIFCGQTCTVLVVMFVSLQWLMWAKNVVILDKIFILDLICSLCLKIIIRCYCGWQSLPRITSILNNHLERSNLVFTSS